MTTAGKDSSSEADTEGRGEANRARRTRLTQSWTAMGMSAACQVLVIYAGLRAGTPLLWLLLACAAGFAGLLVCNVLIRTGWSERLADPALTQVQIAYSVVSIATAYPLQGELRGLALPMTMSILTFSMFALPTRAVARLALLTFVALLLGMLFSLLVWPRHGQWGIELGHAAALLVFLPMMALLSARMSSIRHRLSTQKADLTKALARIEEMALRDALTGLFNRRYAQTLLEQSRLQWQRTKRGFSVALLDIDHFKRINDQHGHAIGDAVLRQFGQVAQNQLRVTDTLCRWGGEEFLLVLADENQPTQAEVAVQRLAQAIRDAGPVEGVSYTFSAGVTAHRPMEPIEAALERADAALYRAKAQGRDRLVMD